MISGPYRGGTPEATIARPERELEEARARLKAERERHKQDSLDLLASGDEARVAAEEARQEAKRWEANFDTLTEAHNSNARALEEAREAEQVLGTLLAEARQERDALASHEPLFRAEIEGRKALEVQHLARIGELEAALREIMGVGMTCKQRRAIARRALQPTTDHEEALD